MVKIKFADEKLCDSIYQDITSVGRKSDGLSIVGLLLLVSAMNFIYLIALDGFTTRLGVVDALGLIVTVATFMRCTLRQSVRKQQLPRLKKIEQQISRMHVIYAITERVDRPQEYMSLGNEPGTLYKVLIVKRDTNKTDVFRIMPELIVDAENGDTVVDFTKISDLRDSIIGKNK